jgi:transcriptional regulator with XRE-family HTH domain
MAQEKTLKDLIKAAKLTYRELAVKLDTSPQSIVAWNQGKSKPTFLYALKLSRELGVSLKTLAMALGEDVSNIPDDVLHDDPWSDI